MQNHNSTKPARQHNLNTWQSKKRAALRVADRLEAAGYPDRAARMRQCSRILVTRSCPLGHTHRVVEAFFCRDRACPICAWRLARRSAGRLCAALSDVGGRALLLTLTLRSCAAEDLRATIKDLLASWSRFARRSRVVKAFDGWFRALEITYNPDTKSWHPHLHVLLHVADPAAYFREGSGLYLMHSEIIELWRSAARLDYAPSVDIRAVRSWRAALEVAKYATKSADILSLTESADLRAWVMAVHGTRQYGAAGVYKAALKAVEAAAAEDLLHHDDDTAAAVCPVCGRALVAVEWIFEGDTYHKMESGCQHGRQCSGAWTPRIHGDDGGRNDRTRDKAPRCGSHDL